MHNKKPHLPQWVAYNALLGEHYSNFFFDLGLVRIQPMEELNNLLQIVIPIQAPDEYGLPLNDEIRTLNQLFDELENAYSAQFELMPVGYVVSNKTCSFYFCVKSIFDYEKIAEEVLKNHPGYRYVTNLIKNDCGAICTDMFFPCYQRNELVQHIIVIAQLEENNDLLSVSRPVDHWSYFRTEKGRADFVELIQQEGFQVENLSEDFDQETWIYGVHFKQDSSVDRETIFNLTQHLWDLAFQCYGNYDGWETFVLKE